MPEPQQLVVTWEIQVDASTPREAAEAAQEMMRDPNSTATVFRVAPEMRHDVYFNVDLDHCLYTHCSCGWEQEHRHDTSMRNVQAAVERHLEGDQRGVVVDLSESPEELPADVARDALDKIWSALVTPFEWSSDTPEAVWEVLKRLGYVMPRQEHIEDLEDVHGTGFDVERIAPITFAQRRKKKT